MGANTKVGIDRERDSDAVVVEELVLELNRAYRGATVDHAYRVGALIIERLYAGHVDDWRAERVKRSSYRRLAARGDLLMSASALCRAVGVYALANHFGAQTRWPHLGVSHYQEVLPLAEPTQLELLTRCDAERWTVARLRSHVQRLRRAGTFNALQRRTARILRAVRDALERQHALLRELSSGGLTPEHVQLVLEIRTRLADVRAQLEALEVCSHGVVNSAAEPSGSGRAGYRVSHALAARWGTP